MSVRMPRVETSMSSLSGSAATCCLYVARSRTTWRSAGGSVSGAIVTGAGAVCATGAGAVTGAEVGVVVGAGAGVAAHPATSSIAIRLIGRFMSPNVMRLDGARHLLFHLPDRRARLRAERARDVRKLLRA